MAGLTTLTSVTWLMLSISSLSEIFLSIDWADVKCTAAVLVETWDGEMPISYSVKCGFFSSDFENANMSAMSTLAPLVLPDIFRVYLLSFDGTSCCIAGSGDLKAESACWNVLWELSSATFSGL